MNNDQLLTCHKTLMEERGKEWFECRGILVFTLAAPDTAPRAACHAAALASESLSREPCWRIFGEGGY